ncbi:hypothetical protein ACH5RR_020310 [Cinchona calisaya]|uniref:Embryo sac development arrest protein n=1 Tax=Cinchona calisaya TaxID=153742 RepID=A0ABD2ZFW1_9GENT
MSATMMNHSRRQLLTPSSNKRKERDGLLDGFKPSPITTKNLAKPSIHRAAPATPVNNSTNKSSPLSLSLQQPQPQPLPPACNNQLLAGYLAHEFLTKGTLFGEAWDPARADAVPVSSSSSSASNNKKRKAEAPANFGKEKDEKRVEKQQRYLEVAELLKGDGAHLPGIVNPTQLARFLQLD